MFKNAIVYRAHGLSVDVDQLEEAASAHSFTPCGPTQTAAAGLVPPRGDKGGAFVESVGGQLILQLTAEKRTVPAPAVKDALEQRLDKVEADTGRRPRGKAKKELKEEVLHELLPRAFPKRGHIPIWIDRKHGLIVIGTGSIKAADNVATLLIGLLNGGVSLQLLQTATAPAKALAGWLHHQEVDGPFTIDRECELKQPDSEGSAVRYTRHTLDIEEVRDHIEQGKLPVSVAMTWAGRVSFVLTDSLELKRITLLDVALDAPQETDYDAFDADVAIATGELSRLLQDLIEALGGELAPDLVGAAAHESQPCAA